jgi:geranylgeranyl pyrophosphate synthase
MKLKEIYRPVNKELIAVDQTLRNSLKDTRCKTILETSNYLLDSGGKRLRPALVLLCAKAAFQPQPLDDKLIDIAAALELIHMASLLHDDVIDHAKLRHSKTTVNFRWGEDIAIALGDYLYSMAFELIATCGNIDILQCVSLGIKAMCEGELIQVRERGNQSLLKERYIVIVRKKTAALFAISCQVGILISDKQKRFQDAAREYGLNFGIAFQIIDDYLDLVAEEHKLGKTPGQDIGVGEVTLPILNLLEALLPAEREEIKMLLASKKNEHCLQLIKSRLITSGAALKTKEVALSYISLAKEKISVLCSSPYKDSLLNLADFIIERGFDGVLSTK